MPVEIQPQENLQFDNPSIFRETPLPKCSYLTIQSDPVQYRYLAPVNNFCIFTQQIQDFIDLLAIAIWRPQ